MSAVLWYENKSKGRTPSDGQSNGRIRSTRDAERSKIADMHVIGDRE